MSNSTILVSHWKNSNDNDVPEISVPHEIQTSTYELPAIINSQTKDIPKLKEPSNNFINRLFPELVPTIRWRQSMLTKNFLTDFFLGFAFIYPILGLIEVMTHKIYWRQLCVFALSYTAIFTTIGAIYYIIIFPVLLTWAVMTLGPLGFILAHIQWLLQTNALTALICRKIILTYMSNQIFDTALYLHGQSDFLISTKFITVPSNSDNQIHWSMTEFWTFIVPLWVLDSVRKILVAIILAGISLIPLIGPPVVNQLISSRRASSYMSRYFILKGSDPKEIKNYEYEHLGLFYSFGMAAGILEFLPVFSIITMTSNTVGAARWSIDIIKKKRS